MTPIFSRFVFLLLLVSLSGCQTLTRPFTDKASNAAGKASDAVVKPADPEAVRLQQCYKDIEVLTKINNPAYASMKQEFDRMMSGAAQYSGIRAQIADNTQSTIDALYRYRVSLLCAKISNEVLNGLTKQAEAPK